jgi:hypothetical protein
MKVYFTMKLKRNRPALGSTKPLIQWVSGALSLGVKRPGREADHLPPSSAAVKNAWRYTSTPNTSSWRGTSLSTGKFYPYLYLYLAISGNSSHYSVQKYLSSLLQNSVTHCFALCNKTSE